MPSTRRITKLAVSVQTKFRLSFQPSMMSPTR